MTGKVSGVGLAKEGSGQANAAGSRFLGGSPGKGGVRAGVGTELQEPQSRALKDQVASEGSLMEFPASVLIFLMATAMV